MFVELKDAIKSTYLCTPYRGSSIDLIQAVARQYKFAYKATKVINWDLPQGIINGIRNYASFLAVIKENPTLTAVPTFEIGKQQVLIGVIQVYATNTASSSTFDLLLFLCRSCMAHAYAQSRTLSEIH
jgi:hypothetical protein